MNQLSRDRPSMFALTEICHDGFIELDVVILLACCKRARR